MTAHRPAAQARALARELAEQVLPPAGEFTAAQRYRYVNRAERLVRATLRDALEQRPVEYAVHRVEDGRVCPDACGTATVRKGE